MPRVHVVLSAVLYACDGGQLFLHLSLLQDKSVGSAWKHMARDDQHGAAAAQGGPRRGESSGESSGESRWRFAIPPAYRKRVFVAISLLLAAIALRVSVGIARAPLRFLLTGGVYSTPTTDGSGQMTMVMSPGLGWFLIFVLVRFMLTRPRLNEQQQ